MQKKKLLPLMLLTVFSLSCILLISGCTKKESADMNKGTINSQNQTTSETQGVNQKIGLYYANPQHSLLVREDYDLNAGMSKAKNMAENAVDKTEEMMFTAEETVRHMLDQLIQGPSNQDLYATLPKETKVNSVKIKDDIAYIDFSQEYLGYSTIDSNDKLALQSVVATISEIPGIKKVKITVDGQPIKINSTLMSDPITRDDSLITPQ